jgi:uncharacterized protein (DUF2141 family)
MKNFTKSILAILLFTFLYAFDAKAQSGLSLTVQVENLQNTKGHVQFTVYNKEGSIPDEKYENYYKIATAEIKGNSAKVIFLNLPKGTYAVNILHDEDKDGEIDKGWVLPKEGIGFSNFTQIGLSNRPNFKKASFELKEDKTISVKVIYM